MEELVTTEALDQEILEDARKKAYRILKTADETLEAQKQDWETKAQKELEELRNSFAERAAKSREEILARLPLDKRRLRSETIEGFLVKAMDDFLRSLSRERLLYILGGELSQRLKDSAEQGSAGDWAAGQGTKPVVLYSGLSLSEVRGVFEKILRKTGSGFLPDIRAEEWEFKEDGYAREFPSVVINTQIMKITASVENAAGTLMKEKRAELAAALLGEGVLND